MSETTYLYVTKTLWQPYENLKKAKTALCYQGRLYRAQVDARQLTLLEGADDPISQL